MIGEKRGKKRLMSINWCQYREECKFPLGQRDDQIISKTIISSPWRSWWGDVWPGNPVLIRVQEGVLHTYWGLSQPVFWDVSPVPWTDPRGKMRRWRWHFTTGPWDMLHHDAATVIGRVYNHNPDQLLYWAVTVLMYPWVPASSVLWKRKSPAPPFRP